MFGKRQTRKERKANNRANLKELAVVMKDKKASLEKLEGGISVTLPNFNIPSNLK